MINYYPEWIVLSSNLPNALRITSPLNELEFVIYDGSKSIYATTLYPNKSEVYFYGLRDIIMQYMEKTGKDLSTFTIATPNHDDQDEDLYMDVCVLYSKIRPSYEYDSEFVDNCFLTTRTHYVIPKTGGVNLRFVNRGNLTRLNVVIDCVIVADGEIKHFVKESTMTCSNRPNTYYVSVWYNSLISIAQNELDEDVSKVLSATATVGNRSMTVYFIDRVPDLVLTCRNAFNCYEDFYIFGTTKLKTEIDAKEAVCNGVTSQYNKTSIRKYVVETAPLTLEEADHFNQFLQSPHIWYMVPPDRDEEVLIEDITSEISDSAKDLVKIKFTWKFADNSHWHMFEEYPNLFTAPYNQSFQ